MKKQKPKAKPGSAKKPTATKAVKADKKAQPAVKPAAKAAGKLVAKAVKPAAKAAVKPAAKGPAVKAVGKAPVAKVTAKPVLTKPNSVKPVAKVAEKAGAKPVKAAIPVKTPASGKSAGNLETKSGIAKSGIAKSDAKAPVKAEKSVKPAVEKVPAAPKIAQAKADPKPIVIEEPDQAEDVILTDADGRRYCRVKDCDRLAEVDAYCRYHYILLWKNIQTRRHILQEGKLERYIEELTARYPDKFLEILKKDLRSEKDFLAAIQELEIDESAVEAEFDDEESQSDLFEIQRVSDSGGGGARSEEDDRF